MDSILYALEEKTGIQTLVVAVTGIAGPDGGTAEKPVGTVWIRTICKDTMVSKKYFFGKSRENNKRRSAVMAMVQMLRCMA